MTHSTTFPEPDDTPDRVQEVLDRHVRLVGRDLTLTSAPLGDGVLLRLDSERDPAEWGEIRLTAEALAEILDALTDTDWDEPLGLRRVALTA